MKAMVMLLGVVPALAQASVCEDLAAISEQAANGFTDWKGNYDADLGEYAATQRLPGASECVIEGDDEFPVYSCRWELSSASEMLSSYRSLVDEISSCSNIFSQGAKVRSMPGQSGSSRYYEYRNENSSWIEGRGSDVRIKVRSKSRVDRKRQQETHLVTVAVEQK